MGSAPITSIDYEIVQNTNLCLIDINNKNKKCPEGWTHTGKLWLAMFVVKIHKFTN